MGLRISRSLPPPDEVPFPTIKRENIAGVRVSISEPPDPSGITFLVPGSMISEESYLSTRRVLHEQNQIVIGFFVNVFTKSHDAYAQDVERIFEEYVINNHTFEGYSIVGHSVGGKIALLAATDPVSDAPSSSSKRPFLYHVLALDPVDDYPPEFTNNIDENRKSNNHGKLRNRSLDQHRAQNTIIMTHADSTPAWSLPRAHNAQAIRNTCHKEGKVSLVTHKNAAHMAYTDNGGGIMGWMMRGGTKEGNQAALNDAHALIRKHFR